MIALLLIAALFLAFALGWIAHGSYQGRPTGRVIDLSGYRTLDDLPSSKSQPPERPAWPSRAEDWRHRDRMPW